MPLRRRGGTKIRFGRSRTYSDVVEQLALTPTKRQTLLRGYFESPDEDGNATTPGPSVAHRAIARMSPGLVAAGAGSTRRNPRVGVSYVPAAGFGQSGAPTSEQEREFIIDAAVMMSQIRVVDTTRL
jgi:hypothetical protein